MNHSRSWHTEGRERGPPARRNVHHAHSHSLSAGTCKTGTPSFCSQSARREDRAMLALRFFRSLFGECGQGCEPRDDRGLGSQVRNLAEENLDKQNKSERVYETSKEREAALCYTRLSELCTAAPQSASYTLP